LSAQLVEQGQFDLLVQGARATPSPDPLVDDPSWKDGFEEMLRTTDPVRLARILRGAAITDLPDPVAIEAIDVPTLILCWTGDPGHPFATAERLAEMIQGSQLAVASTSDQLARWTDRITTFLDALA
jgi:pimeloyl-ACP methyl ester carboxylesterase